MKKRALIKTIVEVEIEWEIKHSSTGEEIEIKGGYYPALKEKLAEAGIAEFHNSSVEDITAEYLCDECGEWKDATEFHEIPKDNMCVDCLYLQENPTEEDKRETYQQSVVDADRGK